MAGASTMTTIVSTCAIAVGIGFLMQYDEAGPSDEVRAARVSNRTAVQSVMASKNSVGDSVFGVPDVVTTPLAHIYNTQAASAIDATYPETETPMMGTILATPFGACQTELSAVVDVAAMVNLTVNAPCYRNAYFVVLHKGMVFSARTDAAGAANLQIPALSADAAFAVSFDNVEVATATLTVPEAGNYDRTVLQWRSKDNLQLHALEFGASLGELGHVWSASTNSPGMAQMGESGFTVRLGTSVADIPYLAEVYTFPSGLLNRDGVIALQLGVAVSDRNCGREVDATSIRTNAGQMLVLKQLTIAIPACDMAGQLIILPNIFQDVTLAAR